MMKHILLLMTLGLFCLGSVGQITKILEIPWNEPNGCKTEMRPDAHYGLEEFEMMSKNEVAILCVVERKIKIYDLTTKSFSSEIPLRYEPQYFTYSKNKDVFFYFARSRIYEIDRAGKLLSSIEINRNIKFIISLKAIENNLYALTTYQESYIIVNESKIMDIDSQDKIEPSGWIFNEENIIRTYKRGKYFSITSLYNKEIKTCNYSLEGYKSGDIRALGQDKECIYICLSYTIQMDPIKIGRKILLYSKSENKVIQEVSTPSISYTSISNDIKYNNGILYQIITTPNSANLYQIKFYKNKKNTDGIKYPDDLNYEYHYGWDHEKKY